LTRYKKHTGIKTGKYAPILEFWPTSVTSLIKTHIMTQSVMSLIIKFLFQNVTFHLSQTVFAQINYIVFYYFMAVKAYF